MASKRSTTRKSAAIGLAIVGIAGLSLAAAAQLNAVEQHARCHDDRASPPCQTTAITATYTDRLHARRARRLQGRPASSSRALAGCVGKDVKVSAARHRRQPRSAPS